MNQSEDRLPLSKLLVENVAIRAKLLVRDAMLSIYRRQQIELRRALDRVTTEQAELLHEQYLGECFRQQLVLDCMLLDLSVLYAEFCVSQSDGLRSSLLARFEEVLTIVEEAVDASAGFDR